MYFKTEKIKDHLRSTVSRNSSISNFSALCHRVCTGHGKPGKSWNLSEFKIKVLFGSLVTADDKARKMQGREE